MDNVVLRLGSPRSQTPSQHNLLQQVTTHVGTLLRQKRNVGVAWNYADTTVTVQPQETTYQLNVSDFGTPLAVLTVNDFQDPNFVVRRIPIFNPADTYFDYNLPENAGAWVNSLSAFDPNHCALRCTFTWRNNIPYIQLIPAGNQQATYAIRYLQSASGIQSAALTSLPLVGEDCDLVEIRAAMSLLPIATWEGLDERANAAKRKELFVSLSEDQRLAKEQFDIAQRITKAPSTSVRWTSVVG